MHRRRWELSLVALLFLASGCFGPSGFQQTNIAGNYVVRDLVTVNMTVHLERAYVRANSGLGGGAAVMWVALGPFARNDMMLYADNAAGKLVQVNPQPALKRK